METVAATFKIFLVSLVILALQTITPDIAFAGGGIRTEGQRVDCMGVAGGSARFGPCGCNQELNASGCCGDEVDLGCGCGITPNSYGCCGEEVNEGCGCGIPLNASGCRGTEVDEGCGCNVSPCEKQCYFVASWANWSGIWRWGKGPEGKNLLDALELYDYTNAEAVPGCFAEHYTDSCYDSREDGSILLFGSCVKSRYRWSGTTVYDLGDFLGVPEEVMNSLPKNFGTSVYGHAEFLMDEDCQYSNWDPETELCGFAGVSWSPISLIIDDSIPLENGMTVVSFSLAANFPKGHSLWKASENAPLLVFDPFKTGKVTSARQLFGNYAFGGVTTRLADYTSEKMRPIWNNGFEALALLDRDKDGRIAGEELGGLYLWYDRNRNADTENGELRPVKEEGIVSLFYEGAKKVSGSEDLILKVGYEKIVDGKKIRGSAIDWYSKVFASRQEAVNALAAIFRSAPAAPDTHLLSLEERGNTHNWPKHPLEFAPHQVSNHKDDLSGFWLWTLKEPGSIRHPGIFAFEELAGKEVIGYSVIESMLENNPEFRSSTTIVPSRGKITINENGEKVFSFEIYDPRSKSKAISVARVSDNGLTLIGTTTQEFKTEKNGKALSATIDYEWQARKIIAVRDRIS